MFQVLINSVDKSGFVAKNSLYVDNALTSQVDTAGFAFRGSDLDVQIGDEVIINYDSVRIFGGRVVSATTYDSVAIKRVEVSCVDWSVDLDRVRIAKVYTGKTTLEIITDIVDKVNTDTGSAFTVTGVKDSGVLGRIAFNYLEPTKCIEQLADSLNYHWYIDEYKDLHFFSRGDESAPFGITNTDGCIRGSLFMTDDFMELRNRVTIRGGDFIADSRTEVLNTSTGTVTYLLAYKYSNLPTVTLDGSPLSVGIENLDSPRLESEFFDCLWDYNQKYLRFKTAPSSGLSLVVTGTPMFPLIIQAEDSPSVAVYGVREHVIEDKTITSIDMGIRRAVADLEAYSNGTSSGEFMTYGHGLRSGQLISVHNDMMGVNDSFLIRAVSIGEHGNDGAIYRISLSSNRFVGIIEFFQGLLLKNKKNITIAENEVPNVIKLDNQTVHLAESITVTTPKTDSVVIDVDEGIRVPDWEARFVVGMWYPVDDDDDRVNGRVGISSYVY